jgi:hypothetical protein
MKTETAELDAVIPRDLALHGSSAPAAPPNDREKREIEAARSRIAGHRRPVRAKVQSKRYGSRTFVSPHADAAGFRARLADAFGSVSPDFLEVSLHQLIQVASHCDCAEGGSELELNASLALVQSVRPTNELEAALALQLAATHPTLPIGSGPCDAKSSIERPYRDRTGAPANRQIVLPHLSRWLANVLSDAPQDAG